MASRQAKRVSRQPNLMPSRASNWVAAGVVVAGSAGWPPGGHGLVEVQRSTVPGAREAGARSSRPGMRRPRRSTGGSRPLFALSKRSAPKSKRGWGAKPRSPSVSAATPLTKGREASRRPRTRLSVFLPARKRGSRALAATPERTKFALERSERHSGAWQTRRPAGSVLGIGPSRQGFSPARTVQSSARRPRAAGP